MKTVNQIERSVHATPMAMAIGGAAMFLGAHVIPISRTAERTEKPPLSKYSVTARVRACIHLNAASTIDSPETSMEREQREFNERAERWERESGVQSSPGMRFLHRDYATIIGMGEKALPFI